MPARTLKAGVIHVIALALLSGAMPLLAQVKPVPITGGVGAVGGIGPIGAGPVISTPTVGTSPGSLGGSIPVVKGPAVVTSRPAQAGGGPSPIAAAATPVVICPVSDPTTRTDTSCTHRLISAFDLYSALKPCNTGPCYARTILFITQSPAIIVTYPAAAAERQQVIAAVKDELAYGVKMMAAYLQEEKGTSGGGAVDLPNLDAIADLVSQAKAEVDAIDQPVGETPEQMRKRLGIPATRKLARVVYDHSRR